MDPPGSATESFHLPHDISLCTYVPVSVYWLSGITTAFTEC